MKGKEPEAIRVLRVQAIKGDITMQRTGEERAGSARGRTTRQERGASEEKGQESPQGQQGGRLEPS